MKLAALLVMVVTGIAAPVVAHGSSSTASGRIPQAQAVRACAGAGAYWPTMTLALQGSYGVGRVQGAGSGRPAAAACGSQDGDCGPRGAGDRRRGRPRLGLGAGLGIDAVPDRPRRARVTKRIQLGASAAVQHLDRRRRRLDRRRPGRGAPPGLPVDEQGRRADPGRRRPGRHGLPRRTRRGRSPTATTPCSGSTRRPTTPRGSDRGRLRRGRRAAGAPRRRALDHGAGPGARRDGPDERSDPPDGRHRRHGHRRRRRRGRAVGARPHGGGRPNAASRR